MGAIEAVWDGDVSQHLADALGGSGTADNRRALGESREGRLLANRVAERVRTDA
jgi:malonate decarboxylase gamma subunit